MNAKVGYWRPLRVERHDLGGELLAGPESSQSLGWAWLDVESISDLPHRLDALFRRGAPQRGYGDRLRIRSTRRQDGETLVIPTLEEWDEIALRSQTDALVPVRTRVKLRGREGPFWVVDLLEAPLVAVLPRGRDRLAGSAFDVLERGALLKLTVNRAHAGPAGRRLELSFRGGDEVPETAARWLRAGLCVSNEGRLLRVGNTPAQAQSDLSRDLEDRVQLRISPPNAQVIAAPMKRGSVYRCRVPGTRHGERPVVLLRPAGLPGQWHAAPLSSSCRHEVRFDPVVEPFAFRPSHGRSGWKQRLQPDVSAYLGRVSDNSLLARLEPGG